MEDKGKKTPHRERWTEQDKDTRMENEEENRE